MTAAGLLPYVNFLGEDGPERICAAYPGPTWDRLNAIKSRYDPTNMFHNNQNIMPIESAPDEFVRPDRSLDQQSI